MTGLGWNNLIEKLYQDLLSIGWDGNVCQVKEKFGTLRVYLGNTTDEMDELVRQAEYASATICEECGEPGTLYGKGWLMTRCGEHRP